MDIGIREATDADLDAVLEVERAAFGREVEAKLTRDLLADPGAGPLLSLLAFADDRPVSHVLFTAAALENAGCAPVAANLSPLAVVPDLQGQGIGSRLTEEGLRRLEAAGVELVFVLGHPAYYPRFGFVPAAPLGIETPYPLSPEHADAWMVLALRDGILGTVTGRVRFAEPLMRPELWRK